MYEMDSASAGIVGICITGCLIKLWETMFAGRGKAALAFPCAVNRVFHDSIACYAHFHDAVFWLLFWNSVVLAVYLLVLVSASFPYMNIPARVL